ncbi:MAG: hypothetical protein GF364_01135, partial [Candidatus Lokiarchaeota archaeon]|nr:hypothetical protein [Candidatus Lokiarchaeota archaeon]
MINIILAKVDEYPTNLFLLTQYILAFIAVGLYYYFGYKFLKRSGKEENEIQKSFFRGFGLFMISAGISIMLFYFDRVKIFLVDDRLFKDYASSVSVFARDYFWVIFAFLLVGATFLIRPVERYLLNKEKMLLSKFTIASWVLLPFLRLFESLFGKTIGAIFWFIIIFFIMINFIVLVISYLKLGNNAPTGSSLKKKSNAIVLGLFLWLIGGFLSDSIAGEKFDVFGYQDINLLAPLGPIIL